MWRYTLRRLLWMLPTLFGISVVVFSLTTLLPEPPTEAELRRNALAMNDPGSYSRGLEARRVRFLDLPRFFNVAPADVRTQAQRLVDAILQGGPGAGLAARELARMGGAALPVVIPALETLGPAERGKVAVALAPVARRMGIGTPAELEDPERATLFWSQFWADRSIDFTVPAVRRETRRVMLRGGETRENEVRVVDTFAMGEIVRAMTAATDRAALERLTSLARHATQRGSIVTASSDESEVRRTVADWEEWLYVHEAELKELTGAERIAAMLSETRFGKWIARLARGNLGLSARDGEPIAPRLVKSAGITLAEAGLALILSFAIAILVGIVAALRRGRSIDTALAFVLLALHSVPTFWLAEALARAFTGRGILAEARVETPESVRFTLATMTLTLASLAFLSREQRAAMLDVLRQDYVRTARAKGVPGGRVLVVHALRNALARTATLVSLQAPALLGMAIVVEAVFALPGFGYEMLQAVETSDVAWLMAATMAAATVTTLSLVLGDVALGALDPRVRETFTESRVEIA